jgi:CubicO group peptidase (beta-lactamase class C family)
MRLFLTVALTWLSLAAFAAELPKRTPEKVGMSSERLASITDAVQRHIDTGNVQGAVVAVARHGKVIYLKAQGQSCRTESPNVYRFTFPDVVLDQACARCCRNDDD